MFNLEEELKKLPGKPGVYLMHDKTDEIIYVGKAISLKNRVRQYFQKSRHVTPKIQRMIDRIAWFEYIVTDSELEALVLECNLIKEHSPRYNTMLKDGKSYPFLKATVSEAYPRLLFARQMKRDGCKYFGPFTSRDTIELVNQLFHLRNCHRVLPRDIGKERPCLYHQIGQCPAPCQGHVKKEEYRADFERALKFLLGDTKSVLKELEEKMQRAAAEMNFEEAATYRDLIQSVRQVTERQKITSEDFEDRDIVAMARGKEDAVVQVFFIRGGKMLGREHYYLTGTNEETEGAVLSAFIKQMYAGTPYIPKEIWLEQEWKMQMLSLSGFRQNADIRYISAIHSAVRKSACLSWRRKMPGWCFKRTLRSYRESGQGRKVRWRKSKACLVFPDSAVWNPMIFQISMVLRRLVQWLCLKREKRKRMITVNFVSVP